MLMLQILLRYGLRLSQKRELWWHPLRDFLVDLWSKCDLMEVETWYN